MNEITWYCSECGTDAGSKGFLYIDYAELRRWKVECWDCKDESRNDYYICTRELRTFKGQAFPVSVKIGPDFAVEI